MVDAGVWKEDSSGEFWESSVLSGKLRNQILRR